MKNLSWEFEEMSFKVAHVYCILGGTDFWPEKHSEFEQFRVHTSHNPEAISMRGNSYGYGSIVIGPEHGEAMCDRFIRQLYELKEVIDCPQIEHRAIRLEVAYRDAANWELSPELLKMLTALELKLEISCFKA